MAYASVTQLREYLKDLPASDETDDLLEAILERATALVDGELGFAFAAYGYTASEIDVYSGAGGKWLYLPAYQSGSLGDVALVSSRGTDDEDTEAETEFVQESRYRLYRDVGWLPRRYYRVSAVWGYGEAPEAIVEVTLQVAVNIWRGRDAMQWSSSVGAEGGGAVSYQRALSWAQRSIIERVKTQYPGESYA